MKYTEAPITDTLTENFMPYAMSVIVSRALPEIDGFKPSHRKLLYTMYKMGLLTGSRTKSANIVGQTMRLNPHGDSAIYETMVRLSRGNGALLTPFVDSKGNFGKVYSRDMAFAAARYTEAKLSGICNEVFSDIDLDCVDFVDNYDSSTKEPALLPTMFPNILANPNLGIAAGMASNICGFDLTELCKTTIEFIINPQHDIMSTLTGPDFPTGGELLFDRNQMEEIYRTGRGSFKLRAKWHYQKKENIIEITEIPYTTTTEAIIDKTTELVKSGKIREIADMRDETGLGGLKIAIDLKRGTDPDKLMAKLMRMTTLTDSFSCNFNILINNRPRVMGIHEVLQEWCDWRVACVKRRVSFDLNKKQEKLHLLKGLGKILLDIDRAIKIIRETDEEAEVVPNLMIGFGIDKVQADYIADIRLRNINKEYILKRLAETKDLEAEINRLKKLLENRRLVEELIISELKSIIKKYPTERKTQIVFDAPDEIVSFEEEIEDYTVFLFYTREGYFKKITPQSLRMSGEHKLKEGDEMQYMVEANNRSEIIFITDRAQAYKTKASDFADSKASVLGDFIPRVLEMEEGESPIFMLLPGDFKGSLIYAFENGKIARVELSSFATKSNRKKLTGAYNEKSPIVQILHITEDVELAVFSANRMLIFSTALMQDKASRTTQGVSVISLKKGMKLEGIMYVSKLKPADPARYRVRNIPAAGALIKEDDAPHRQMTMDSFELPEES